MNDILAPGAAFLRKLIGSSSHGVVTGMEENDNASGLPATKQIKCAGCSISREILKRLPTGWKRSGENYWCSDCWSERYVLRAIVMPVVKPLDAEWKQLGIEVRAMWAATTQASNWMITELYTRDVRRGNEPKMPPMERMYLYPEARQRFPSLPSQSIAALEKATQQRYRAVRYETIWTCSRSLPTFRYPVPFAVPNQSWSADFEENAPVISVRIGDKRWRLRLKGGPRFRRQWAAFGDIVSGGAVRGELAIYERSQRMMVKMIAWLPRAQQTPNRARSGVLRVRTTADHLFVALNTKDETIWRYNGDHIRRWTAEHKRQMFRWSEDSKFEARPVPDFADRRRIAAEKYRNRLNSAVQQAAAYLAGYAVRRCFAVVQLDDSERGFCEDFPWAALRTRIQMLLDQHGIGFPRANTKEPPKDEGQSSEQTGE